MHIKTSFAMATSSNHLPLLPSQLTQLIGVSKLYWTLM